MYYIAFLTIIILISNTVSHCLLRTTIWILVTGIKAMAEGVSNLLLPWFMTDQGNVVKWLLFLHYFYISFAVYFSHIHWYKFCKHNNSGTNSTTDISEKHDRVLEVQLQFQHQHNGITFASWDNKAGSLTAIFDFGYHTLVISIQSLLLSFVFHFLYIFRMLFCLFWESLPP